MVSIYRKTGGYTWMDMDLIKAILSLLLILLVIVTIFKTIINRRKQIKQRKQKWEQLDRSEQLSEDEKILEVFPFADQQMNEQVRLLLIEGKRVTAIKMVRDRSKLGLREAQEYVEAVERRLLD
jgi:ribosomal protein L7/L12